MHLSVIVCSKIEMFGLVPLKTVIVVLSDFLRDKDDQAVDPLWPFRQPFGTPFTAWHHQVENLFEVAGGAPEARASVGFYIPNLTSKDAGD
jgi:hypothetical protein